jgi:hypothetical protein
MRAFYLSIVLFLLMLGVIASSMAMNRHVCGRMQEALDAVGDDPTAEALAHLEEIQAFWLGWRDLVRLTVNQTVWRAVNDSTMALVEYARLGDEALPEFVGAKAQLLCAVQEMSRPERATLKTIL